MKSLVMEAANRNLSPCDVCGALKADPCRAPSGRTRAPHQGRDSNINEFTPPDQQAANRRRKP